MRRRSLWQWLYEAASLYLGLVLMALLALASWWLVRNAPQPLPAPRAAARPDVPDYVLHGFAMRQFDAQGRMSAEVTGTTAHHYPENDMLVIENVRTRSLGADGSITTSSAREGRSLREGQELQLLGDALIQRQGAAASAPVVQVQGPQLHIWQHEQRLHSPGHVVIVRGSDRFSAERMDYDHASQVLQLQGRVRGLLPPRSDAAAAPQTIPQAVPGSHP